MKRPQYVFRPNLNEPQHRRAWALLQQVPPAKRKEFLVQSILAAEQTDRLEKSIRKVVREELQAGNITGAVPSPLSENQLKDRWYRGRDGSDYHYHQSRYHAFYGKKAIMYPTFQTLIV